MNGTAADPAGLHDLPTTRYYNFLNTFRQCFRRFLCGESRIVCYCSLVNWIQAGAGGAVAEYSASVTAPPQPLSNVPIQYGLIIKILDMFFDCKHDRLLQNIHS